MSIEGFLTILSKFARYPIITLIAIAIGIVVYENLHNVVVAVGWSLMFIGFPLLLMTTFELVRYGVRKYLVKRLVDFSTITLIAMLCIKEPHNLRLVVIFLLIVLLWVIFNELVEWVVENNEKRYVIVDLRRNMLT